MASPRRAHQVVVVELPSVGEWAATSPHSNHVSSEVNDKGGSATS
jgi:hypothetical protein